MIISKTPLRISFFGGGTDLPEYFLKRKGAVISTAINKYVYHSISYHPAEINDSAIKIAYSKIENVNHLDEIKHAPFREIIREMGLKKDIEIHVVSDLPSYSGLGSSSSFTVGLIKILTEYKNNKISAIELAKKAVYIERNLLNEAVGLQDQTIASFGGICLIEFNKNEEIKVTPVNLSELVKDELSNSLMLFYTGIKRKAEELEKKKIENLNSITQNLDNILKNTYQAAEMLNSNFSLSKFGELLNTTWQQKKLLANEVSNNVIDGMYDVAINSGAVGGKLLGAGGGGFLLLVVPDEKKNYIRKSLKDFYEIEFSINAPGSTIIASNN